MRIIALLFFFIPFLSCNNAVKENPNILSRDQMVDILTDIQIVEAKLSFETRSSISFEKISKKYYESVFAKYDINREEFDESMHYYEKNIEELNSIYSDVITNLSKIQSEVNEKEMMKDTNDQAIGDKIPDEKQQERTDQELVKE